MGLEDLPALIDIEGIFNGLKPNDEDPQYKYLRSLGSTLLVAGILLVVIFLLAIEFIALTVSLAIGIIFAALLMFAGIGLIWYTHDDAKEFQEIEKGDREAEVSKKEAEASMKEEEAARESLKTIAEHERMPLDQRAGNQTKPDDSNQTRTPDSENIEYEE